MIRKAIETCLDKKKKVNNLEADGGYGDLGAIPTAPNNISKDKKKEKDLMIVDGDVKEETK